MQTVIYMNALLAYGQQCHPYTHTHTKILKIKDSGKNSTHTPTVLKEAGFTF